MPLAHALVHTVGSVGRVPRDALLREAGLSAAFDARDRLELVELARLHEAAQRLTGHAALGLAMCRQAGQTFDVVGHMMSHADTLHDAIGLAARYGHLIVEDYHLKLHLGPTEARVTFELARSAPAADRLLADFVMAGMQHLIRACVEPRAAIGCVRFEHEAPKDLSAYSQMFECPVYFSQPHTAIEFPRRYLSAVPSSRDPEIVSLLREQAERRLARRVPGQVTAGAIASYLRACAPNRLPTMNETARDLGLSPRSLRRRLAEEGASFRALSQAALQASATQMLGEGRRPVPEVASRLGFTDVSSFERAFKRWTGSTPRQYVRSGRAS
jgi:AraC-like DNA-binding protein